MASQLADRSDAVAVKLDTGDPCGALADAESLQQQTIAAVNAGRVPPRYQEELTAAVGALAASIPCPVTPPAAPDPAAPEEDGEDDEEGDEDEDGDREEDDDDEAKDDKGEKRGKGKGKGQKGQRG